MKQYQSLQNVLCACINGLELITILCFLFLGPITGGFIGILAGAVSLLGRRLQWHSIC